MTQQSRHGVKSRPPFQAARRNHVQSGRTEENARLWEHVLHEDGQFFQSANYFLLSESLLVVAYSGLLAASAASGVTHGFVSHISFATRTIAAFGLALTVVWLYVGHRRLRYCRYIQAIARDRLPDYRVRREGRPKNLVSPFDVVTYSVPFLAGILWILFLVIA
jgi:hypothetical protein